MPGQRKKNPDLDISELSEVSNEPITSTSQDAGDNSQGKSQDKSQDKSKPPVVNQFLRLTQQVQRYSSYTFTAFLTLHASSVIVAPLISTEVANSSIQFSAAIYRGPFNAESILVWGSLACHIASGLILRVHKVYLDAKYRDRFVLPSQIALSGYVAAPLVLGHALITRIAPHLVTGDSSLAACVEYINYGLHKYPLILPAFYITLVTVTSFHVTGGWLKWLRVYGNQKYEVIRFAILNALLAAVSVSVYRIYNLVPVSGWLQQQYNKIFNYLYL